MQLSPYGDHFLVTQVKRSALSPESTASSQDDNTDPRKVWFEMEYKAQQLKSQGQNWTKGVKHNTSRKTIK